MKPFAIACPHCSRAFWLTDVDVDSWWNDHVLNCAGRTSYPTHIRNTFGRWLDAIAIRGAVLLKRFKDGELLSAKAGENIITTVGKGLVIDRLTDATVAVADYQAVGTGSATPAAGDTTLATEIGTRVQGVLSQPIATTSRLTSTFIAGNATGTLVETGRFNASTSGVLVARFTFDAEVKGVLDELEIVHDITIS